MGKSQSKETKNDKYHIFGGLSALGATQCLSISPEVVDFNAEGAMPQVGDTVEGFVTLTSEYPNKMKFKFERSWVTACEVKFKPDKGSIKSGKSKKIKVQLKILKPSNLNFKVTLRAGPQSFFVGVRIRTEVGVFGVDVSSLEQVPAVLANLRKELVDTNAFQQEGDTEEIRKYKADLNAKTYKPMQADVNTVASLLKMPVPLLQEIPKDKMFHCDNVDDVLATHEAMTGPNRVLLDWMLKMLAQVARNSAINKMSCQNLAIVVAPNLYDVSVVNPTEGLVISQKCAQFLHTLLVQRMRVEMEAESEALAESGEHAGAHLSLFHLSCAEEPEENVEEAPVSTEGDGTVYYSESGEAIEASTGEFEVEEDVNSAQAEDHTADVAEVEFEVASPPDLG